MRYNVAMPVSAAELSSIHTSIADLVATLARIAEDQHRVTKEDPLAAELLAIEGQLRMATRRLEKLVSRL